MIRATSTTDIIQLSRWCRRLHREQSKKADVINRFAIGLYQLCGLFEWKDDDNTNESKASACIHFITAAEVCRAPMIIEMIPHIEEWRYSSIDMKRLLKHITFAQRDVFYFTRQGVTRRGSRFSDTRLGQHIGDAVFMLMSSIEPSKRSDAIYAATDIMTRRL